MCDLSWEEYFMAFAKLTSLKSQDPNTKVGACIVKDNNILSTGYNSMVGGCDNNQFTWEKNGDFLNSKYAYVCHAELNAILNYKGNNLQDSTIYVTLFPCNECCKAIIQAGIKKVVYLSNKYKDTDPVKASKKMFDVCGINLEKYNGINNILIDLKKED